MADSIQTWAAKVLAGDRRAIARGISAVEAGDTLGTELLKTLFPASGKAEVIGVTGSPGAGKSTLVEKLAGMYRRAGARVGIIAVDPTSPFSGGALLGDRIRMQSLASDKEIYIRSMATRGQLGGLAPTTHDVVTILDAAGCEVVLIETVGVGQDEVEVARLADATALLLVPGMGDDVQTFKAGVFENIARERLHDGSLQQFVDDLLQHRADPYSLVERIVAESVKQVSGVRCRGNSEL
jgi:LAO/AO transport system kinase